MRLVAIVSSDLGMVISRSDSLLTSATRNHVYLIYTGKTIFEPPSIRFFFVCFFFFRSKSPINFLFRHVACKSRFDTRVNLHRIGGNPERYETIDERGSIIQSAFYGTSIKLFFFNRKKVLKVMMSIKWISDMFKDVPHEVWLLGFN